MRLDAAQSTTSWLSLAAFLQESPEHVAKSTRRLCLAAKNLGEASLTILISWLGSFFTSYSSTNAYNSSKMPKKMNVL